MKINRKKNKKVWVVFIICLLLISFLVLYYFRDNLFTKSNLLSKNVDYSLYYNKYVITNKESILYKKDGKKYLNVGKIASNVELELAEESDKDEFFAIKNLADYYIKYSDVDVIDTLSFNDERFKKYIPFNENVVTKDKTNFYDVYGNFVYEFDESFSLAIIVKEDNKYGVIFDNKLLFINKEDVKEVIDNHNTDLNNSSGVGVLNYHAFYDENNYEEANSCNTIICHSLTQFKSQLDYFKDNNIFSVTMWELEHYIDGNLKLPKSVAITIDDGPKSEQAVEILDNYKMNATIFLVTSWYEGYDLEGYFNSDYIELHSHSHNMHGYGVCPGGQGGGIKCLDEETIQNDLTASRKMLNNSTIFCYPFYEYNDYSIEMLKEAGFTMAFAGESGDSLVHVGDNKFYLNRFIIVSYTTIDNLDNYFNQIY